jgi:hypothetical protein
MHEKEVEGNANMLTQNDARDCVCLRDEMPSFPRLHQHCAIFAADAPTLHPKASALPFTHQGPFVTTADGGVLCIDSKNALRSTDEGRTWTNTPLFADPAKFHVSNERALLRTREASSSPHG